jgi:hypothetical protein
LSTSDTHPCADLLALAHDMMTHGKVNATNDLITQYRSLNEQYKATATRLQVCGVMLEQMACLRTCLCTAARHGVLPARGL